MNPLLIKFLVCLALVAGIFYAGMRVEQAFTAERDLAIVEAKEAFIDVYQEAESGKSKQLEDKLSSLKTNERIIEREKIKVITRPVYLNECIDANGVQVIERARAGQASTAEPAN